MTEEEKARLRAKLESPGYLEAAADHIADGFASRAVQVPDFHGALEEADAGIRRRLEHLRTAREMAQITYGLKSVEYRKAHALLQAAEKYPVECMNHVKKRKRVNTL